MPELQLWQSRRPRRTKAKLHADKGDHNETTVQEVWTLGTRTRRRPQPR
jgi:hypothetical protein